MRHALVSVVIATYNRASVIARAIESIQAQDYPNKEIIIVNDGSSDDTLGVLAQYPGIVVISNKQNLRLQKSLNIGCRAANGKYIARLDDHDEWTDSSKLSKQIEFLESNPEYGLIGTGFRIGTRILVNPLSDIAIRRQMLFRCPFCHYTVVFRKDLYEQVGGYDESLSYSEDWDLWMRMGLSTQMINLPDITTSGEVEKGSLTDRFYVKQFGINQGIIQKHKQDYPRKWLASSYQGIVWCFFKVFKKDSLAHSLMTKVYTWCFARR